MKLQRPLPQRGPVKARWAQHHAISRRAVLSRCRGKCEGCGTDRVPLEWAHLAGRRHLVREPWCSSPELTAALCGECHRAIDRNLDLDLLTQLRWDAVERLARKLPDRSAYGVLGSRPLDVIRRLVDALEAQG